MTYKEIKSIVTKRIKDGSLPKSYKLPPEAEVGIPATIPENYSVVFIPTGLSFDQWDALLKKTCNGLWVWSEYNKAPFKKAGWKVELVYSASEPSNTNVTYTDTEKTGTVSLEAYLALQWNLLESGKQPVDKDTWTWCKNDDAYGLPSGRAPASYWDSSDGQVSVVQVDVGFAGGLLGARLPVRGTNPEPLATSAKAPAIPFSLEVPEIVFNGKTYVLRDE